MSSAIDGPISCSTGYSKEVLDHLADAKLSSAALAVCLHFHNLTFGNAGSHRSHGESELSCIFDLASWGARLKKNRSNLQRLIRRLEQHRVLMVAPIANQPGRAILTWNIHFETWIQGYDVHHLPEQALHLGGYAQKRPSKLNTVAIEPAPSELSMVAQNQPSELNTVAAPQPSELSMVAPISVPSKLTLPAKLRTIKTKDACLERALQEGSSEPNKSTNKSNVEEETYIAAIAAQGVFPFMEVPIARPKGKHALADRDGSMKERKPYPHQAMLEVMRDALGYGPEGGEWEKWSTGFKNLKIRQVDTQELQDLVVEYRRQWPEVDCNPMAVYGHLGKLRYEVKKKRAGASRPTAQGDTNGEPRIYARYL